MANVFAGRAVLKTLKGGGEKISALKNEIAEQDMWLEEQDYWERRRGWLDGHMPPPIDSVGKAQGDLMQEMQQQVLDRKLRIDRQNLIDPVHGANFDEVAVYLRVRGDAAVINQWVASLQSPEKFQVLKTLELELDNRARETTPQGECQITIARWFAPQGSQPAADPAPAEAAPEAADPAPPPVPEAPASTTPAPEAAPESVTDSGAAAPAPPTDPAGGGNVGS
ncbi:MAG: hypothetical protein KDM91_12705 [Verrucomicrobiae bacterium]|nr:hypothetical protein [Verrucomicrobiae bacterium]MCP5541001.1 hypothetical protein [Akkermansiaceae bacterium]MCP5550823.1 hypothetical protein [Akkermansiaceae bacterium]